MKSLNELAALRDKNKKELSLGETNKGKIRVVVGMATCGIAAGAVPVYDALVKEIKNRNLNNVFLTQTGCIGVCRVEPIVEVLISGKEKVTYVNVTPEKVSRIVSAHLVNGSIVSEYTIGMAE